MANHPYPPAHPKSRPGPEGCGRPPAADESNAEPETEPDEAFVRVSELPTEVRCDGRRLAQHVALDGEALLERHVAKLLLWEYALGEPGSRAS